MLVRACNVYFISRFGFSVMHALSLDMMRLNLARDYLFYLKQNTADLTRDGPDRRRGGRQRRAAPDHAGHAPRRHFHLPHGAAGADKPARCHRHVACARRLHWRHLSGFPSRGAVGRPRARSRRYRPVSPGARGFRRLQGAEAARPRKQLLAPLRQPRRWSTPTPSRAAKPWRFVPMFFVQARGRQRRHCRASVSRLVLWRPERGPSIRRRLCLRRLPTDAVAAIADD